MLKIHRRGGGGGGGVRPRCKNIMGDYVHLANNM